MVVQPVLCIDLLLSASVCGLRRLLDVCTSFGKEQCLHFKYQIRFDSAEKADKVQISLTILLHLCLLRQKPDVLSLSNVARLSRKLAIVFHISTFFLDWLRSLAPFILLFNIKTTFKTSIMLRYYFVSCKSHFMSCKVFSQNCGSSTAVVLSISVFLCLHYVVTGKSTPKGLTSVELRLIHDQYVYITCQLLTFKSELNHNDSVYSASPQFLFSKQQLCKIVCQHLRRFLSLRASQRALDELAPGNANIRSNLSFSVINFFKCILLVLAYISIPQRTCGYTNAK